MGKITITRTAFCQRCFDAKRPKTGDAYAVFGSSGWHIRFVEYAHPHDNPFGFTPHLFELGKLEQGFVTGAKTCCMNDCGTDIRENPDYEKDATQPQYLIYYNEKLGFRMSVPDWNALITTKNFGLRLT